MKILLAGASGLIGSRALLLAQQCQDISSVLCLNRRELHSPDDKICHIAVDWQQPDSWQAHVSGDVLWLCLGTSKHNNGTYQEVDKTLSLAIARQARANGVKRCIVISSAFACAKSMSTYLRIKGELEDELQSLDFAYLSIFRPGPLKGRELLGRQRWDEQLSAPIIKLANLVLGGERSPLASNHANKIAQLMIKDTLSDQTGVQIRRPAEINSEPA